MNSNSKQDFGQCLYAWVFVRSSRGDLKEIDTIGSMYKIVERYLGRWFSTFGVDKKTDQLFGVEFFPKIGQQTSVDACLSSRDNKVISMFVIR